VCARVCVCVAIFCSVLQYVGLDSCQRLCALQCVAVRVLQCATTSSAALLQYDAACCSVLQCVAVRRSVLQCGAVCCSVLQ